VNCDAAIKGIIVKLAVASRFRRRMLAARARWCAAADLSTGKLWVTVAVIASRISPDENGFHLDCPAVCE
jgi:hypothetical protein